MDNIKQERGAFDAWHNDRIGYKPTFINACGRYIGPVQERYEAFQAGRTALQSQDREDAERYRLLRSAGKETERIVDDMYECALSGEDLDAAIDHARRTEGGGE